MIAPSAFYGVRIALDVPHGPRPNLAAIIKPLIDGIVAGLHSHNQPWTLSELAEIVGRDAGITREAAAHELASEDGAILGPRRLLWKRAGGVQWNPADDRCVVGDLILHSANTNDWSVSALMSSRSLTGDGTR